MESFHEYFYNRFGYDLDDEEIADMMMVADYNKDGLVTMEDFATAVKRVCGVWMG